MTVFREVLGLLLVFGTTARCTMEGLSVSMTSAIRSRRQSATVLLMLAAATGSGSVTVISSRRELLGFVMEIALTSVS